MHRETILALVQENVVRVQDEVNRTINIQDTIQIVHFVKALEYAKFATDEENYNTFSGKERR